MSWSTTAPTLPTGSSWGEWKTTNTQTSNTYYNWRVSARVARGPNDTAYVAVRLQQYMKDYGATAALTSFRAGVQVNNGSYSYCTAKDYTSSFGEWTTVRTWYYTGTAAVGVDLDVRGSAAGSQTGELSFSAPPYTSNYTVTFNGNGATSGSVAGVTDIYGANITLPSGDDFRYPGFGFVEWNTAADGSGTAYAAGASYTIMGAATLYAQWVKTSIPVCINVGGSIKQGEQAYVNVGGTIKECTPYVNVGGQIYGLG